MLDSTFWPQLNFINSLLPSPALCQRALFSASFARKVRPYVDQIFNHCNQEKLYENIKECERAIGFDTKIRSYSLLILGKLNRLRDEVTEKFVALNNDAGKQQWLQIHLKQMVVDGKIIIFVNQKTRALEVQEFIKKNLNLKVPCIYGDMYTVERHQVLQTFRKDSDVLISTDVLGRGIDVREVE
jgi:superfamily II DNA/RNA helicase